MRLSQPLKIIFGTSAAGLVVVAGLAGVLGAERFSEEMSSGVQSCTITESHMGIGASQLKSGQQVARTINFIKTAECGNLRNDTLQIPLGIPLAPQKDTYCKLQPGDTWQLQTFKRAGSRDKFIAKAVKLEKTTPSLKETPAKAQKRADFCTSMALKP